MRTKKNFNYPRILLGFISLIPTAEVFTVKFHADTYISIQTEIPCSNGDWQQVRHKIKYLNTYLKVYAEFCPEEADSSDDNMIVHPRKWSNNLLICKG